MDIEEAIAHFEKLNDLRIADYCTAGNRKKNSKVDNLISYEVFEDNINKWLSMTSNDELKEEMLLLLSNFRYLTDDEFEWQIGNIVDEVLNDSSLSIDRVLFLLIPSKKYCESGSTYLNYKISKLYRGEISINNIRTFAPLSDLDDSKNDVLMEEQTKLSKTELLEKYAKDMRINIDDFDAIVFVDDIIGSGSTIYKYIKSFVNAYPTVQNKKVYLSCICANESLLSNKIEEIEKDIVHFRKTVCAIFQKKCYTEQMISDNIDLIRELEELIERNSEDNETSPCVMGFREGQFLIAFFYNTPNNTLSLFWRKTEVSPYPLFIRNRQTRPTIDKLNEIRQINRANSYNMGRRE